MKSNLLFSSSSDKNQRRFSLSHSLSFSVNEPYRVDPVKTAIQCQHLFLGCNCIVHYMLKTMGELDVK